MKLKFRHRLLITPAVATAFLLIILAISVWFGGRNDEQLASIEKRYAPAVEVSRDLAQSLGAIQRALQDAAAAEDADALRSIDPKRDAFRQRLIQAGQQGVLSRQASEALLTQFDDYLSLARATTEKMIKKSDPAGLPAALEQMTQSYRGIDGALKAQLEADHVAMTEAFAGARSAQRNTTFVEGVMMLFCVLGLVLLSLRTYRQMARPLGQLTSAVYSIAVSGDLATPITVQSDDEIGELATAFREMVGKLRAIPLTLRDSVGQLSTAVGSLSEQTGVQTEVLQRQAEGLSEASATTQEIRQTSSVAVNKAETVLQVALKAEELTAAGQKSVEASLSGLQAIRTQVDQMVRNIQDLSERTLAVGEVIQRVKDLADQSNMLALNAAIEATKAGEYGRGFAVVAREIRSLADQSLQSTNRIREIIGEIQTAIRGAVSNSQEGVRKVEEGINDIRTSGENFRGITAIIDQSSQAARQIVASVNQQNLGIAQISTAITDLNTAMEQALAGVEVTRKSAFTVSQTSKSIESIVSGFRT